jgi:hypothetical protein
MRHAIAIAATLLAEGVVIRLFGPLAGLVIPFVGACLNLVFVVMKIGRTGAFTTWGLMKHQSTREERLLQVYGLSIIAGSIVELWAFHAAAAN